jgi:hypothetical protein
MLPGTNLSSRHLPIWVFALDHLARTPQLINLFIQLAISHQGPSSHVETSIDLRKVREGAAGVRSVGDHPTPVPQLRNRLQIVEVNELCMVWAVASASVRSHQIA